MWEKEITNPAIIIVQVLYTSTVYEVLQYIITFEK